MSVRDTTGVSGLVGVLGRLAEGSPWSVAELARDEGLSRSSAFALARRLEAAQLVARDLEGKLIAGPQAIALAYARFGLARLHGPAEAVLRWLRDHGAARAELTCDGDRTALLSFSADGAKPAGATFSHAICDESGGAAARLEVVCRRDIAASERAEIERLALRAKATLEHHLREPCGSPLPVRTGRGEARDNQSEGGKTMLFGASTFIWTSPFSNETLSLIDHAKALGFDILEICIEDPDTIDSATILSRLQRAGLKVTVCGAFGPSRDVSSDEPEIRENGLAYLDRCVDIAKTLGSRTVVGPMYSAVGKTRMLEAPERAKQWRLAVESLRRAADFAADRGVTLGIEPLNRFETDLVNTVEQGLRMVKDIDRPNVGLLLDTFHMNIEEKDIPAALRSAGRHIVEFHACSSDRGTPGEDHLPWPEIVDALRDVDYRGPVVIEAFTPKIKEIARAVALWRPLAESEDALASNGLRHLKAAFSK